MKGQTGQGGFTLIEVLVVINIIALVAACLFPTFMRARAKAGQTTCLSNERQFGAAFLMYASDNDDKFPLMFLPLGASVYTGAMGQFDYPLCTCPGNDPTKGSLYPYTKNAQIYLCSSDSEPDKGLSYACNGWLTGYSQGAINDPAGKFLLVDEDNCTNDVFVYNGGSGLDVPAMAHNDGCNVACADGHAQWVSRGQWPTDGVNNIRLNPSL
jgi:prepilin-type N-terminal cleavage/methylation domain-containing protein/prepilin-type processing-associated H-X9-DG protein